jgi:hypothetical protein
MLSERRSVEVQFGTNEDNPKFREAAVANAQQAIESAEDLRREVDGIPRGRSHAANRESDQGMSLDM